MNFNSTIIVDFRGFNKLIQKCFMEVIKVKNSQHTNEEKKLGRGNSFPDIHYCNVVEIRATWIWNRDRKI